MSGLPVIHPDSRLLNSRTLATLKMLPAKWTVVIYVDVVLEWNFLVDERSQNVLVIVEDGIMMGIDAAAIDEAAMVEMMLVEVGIEEDEKAAEVVPARVAAARVDDRDRPENVLIEKRSANSDRVQLRQPKRNHHRVEVADVDLLRKMVLQPATKSENRVCVVFFQFVFLVV